MQYLGRIAWRPWTTIGDPAQYLVVLFWLIITTTKLPYSKPLKDLVNYTVTGLWNHVLNATRTKLD